MKMKVQFLAMLACASLTMACSGDKQKDNAAAEQDEKPIVKLASVTSRPVEQTEVYTATVESDVKNNISSSSPLRIEKIYVEVGDHVSAGQTLVQMDASNLRQLQLQIQNQKVEYARVEELFKVGGASQSELDAAKTQLDINQTQYRNLSTNTRLLSPCSGVVTARNYDNGDMTGSNPILTIEKLTPVKMIINVSETHYPDVKVGMPVKITVDTYGDEVFAGKVSIVAPTVDAATHTFQVEITLPNSQQKVRPGMFARATINYGTTNSVVVPDQAVVKQSGSGDHYVYVYNNGKVSYNKVELGQRLGSEYELKAGVPNNSQVVIAGQTRLANGVEVKVVK